MGSTSQSAAISSMLVMVTTLVLKVHIHCKGCETKVRKVLKEIEGVLSINIEPVQGKVTVIGNVEPDILIKRLKKKGKHAELWASGVNNRVNNQAQGMQVAAGNGQDQVYNRVQVQGMQVAALNGQEQVNNQVDGMQISGNGQNQFNNLQVQGRQIRVENMGQNQGNSHVQGRQIRVENMGQNQVQGMQIRVLNLKQPGPKACRSG